MKSKIFAILTVMLFASILGGVAAGYTDSTATGVVVAAASFLGSFAVPAYALGFNTPGSLKEAFEKRAGLITEMNSLHTTAKEAKRDFTAEEDTRFNALSADIDKYTDYINKEQRISEINKIEGLRHEETKETKSAKELRQKAFASYLRNGIGGMNEEERNNLFKSENRDVTGQVSDVDGQGGYLVPDEFSNEVEVALKAMGGLMEIATILRTNNGRTINYPIINDTSNAATIVGQLVAPNAATKTFSNKTINAYTYVTDAILVSFQLLRDEGYDINSLLTRLHTESIFRGFNAAATTGAGTTGPEGCVTAATASGVTAAAAAVTYDNLIDLIHSIDPAYRKSPKFALMFNDSTFKAIRKLKDDVDMPIWQPALAMGAPDTLLGQRYVINQDMANIGASAKSILCGDFSKFILRMVNDVSILRLTERYADQLAVGFIGYQSLDSRLLDAGTHPIKSLVHAAS